MPALRPTASATGTMTSCAATMHTDISVVPSSLFARNSFWPTRGSISALAKWKITAQIANTRSGLLVARILRPDGLSGSSGPVLSLKPRARSWSMASAGMESVANTLATAMAAMSQNTAIGPKA